MSRFRIFYKKSILLVWFAFFAALLVLYAILAGFLFDYTKNAVVANNNDKISYALSSVSGDFENFATGAEEIYSSLVVTGTFNNYSNKTPDGYDLYTLKKALAPFSAGDINYMLWFEDYDILVSTETALPCSTFYNVHFNEYFEDFESFSENVLNSSERMLSKQIIDSNDSYAGKSIIFYTKKLFSPTEPVAIKFIAYTYSDTLLYNSMELLEKENYALVFKNDDRTFFAQSDIKGFEPSLIRNLTDNQLKINRRNYVASSYSSGIFEYTYIMSEEAYNKPLRRIYISSSLILVLFFIFNIILIYWFVRRNYKPIQKLLNLLEIQFNYSTNEFDELNKKFSLYKEIQMKTSEELNLKRKVAQHYIMLNIIDNNYVSNDDIDMLFDGVQPHKYSFVVVISAYSDDASSSLLNDTVADMLSKISGTSDTIIRSMFSNRCLIILINTPQNDSFAFDNDLDAICQIAELTYNTKLHIGIGKCCDALFNINESYNEAMHALRHARSSNKRIFHCEDTPNISSGAYYYPPELEFQLLKSLTVSDFTKAESILEKIYMVNFNDRSLSPLMENLLFSNIIGTFSKFIDLSPLTSSIHSVNPENFVLTLSKSKNSQEKQELISGILQMYKNTLNNERQDKDSSIIKSVKKYINQNYNNPELNVSTTAMHFGIRQDYLSRLFKQHEGINLLKYINIVRLNRAAKMLETTSKTIAEIAEEAGFYSYRTFTRQFIAHFNTTAQQYRDDNKK